MHDRARAPVVVWPHKMVSGWKGDLPLQSFEVEKFPAWPMELALTTQHRTDAHFVPYHVPGLAHAPRVNKRGLPALRALGLDVRFTHLVLDVDSDEAHRQNVPATQDWRARHYELRENLPEELYEGMAWYETQGGYRMLWQLPEELSPEDYKRWVLGLHEDALKAGIEADPLKDWGRCYRLARVMRGGVMQDYPMDLDSLGDALVWRPRSSIVAVGQTTYTPGVYPQGTNEGHSGDIPTQTTSSQSVDPFIAGMLQRAGKPVVAVAPAAVPSGLDMQAPERQPFELPAVIGQGQRNTMMMRLAGKARYSHAGEDEILDLLRVTNQKRCRPPLDDEELQSIAHSAAGMDPGRHVMDPVAAKEATTAAGVETAPNTFRFHLGSDVELTDIALEDMEVACGGRIIADRGHLWRYSATARYWQSIRAQELQRAVMQYDGENVYEGMKADGSLKLKPLKLRTPTVMAVLKLALASRDYPRFFDDAPRGLTMNNGFLTLDDNDQPVILPHDPEHRSMFGLPYDYVRGAVPHAFVKMLFECFEGDEDAAGKVQLLREWIGVAEMGYATKMAKGLILVGEGANGKSTVQEIVSALFPREHRTAVAPQEMEQEYRRAELALSRLNVVAEMPEADLLESTAVKALLAGDEMGAREIREAPFHFEPRAAHLFSANNLPSVRDLSHGFWRRWLVLNFNRIFTEQEQDKGLARRIIKTELGAIASWCLDGAVDALKRGHFAETASMTHAVERWKVDSNPVAAWVEVEVDAEAMASGETWTSSAQAYNRYCMFASENGYARMSSQKFGRRLTSLGFVQKKDGKGMRGFVMALRQMQSVVPQAGAK